MKHLTIVKGLVGCIIFICFFGKRGSSQTLTVDPTLTAAVTIQGGAETNKLGDISSLQTKIAVATAAATVIADSIRSIQKKIFTGLTEVYNGVNDAYHVALIGKLCGDIIVNEGKVMGLAAKNPLALAFATSLQSQVISRSVALGTMVKTLILKSDKKMLLTSGDRMRSIDEILQEVSVINSLVISSYFRVKMVVEQGILNSLNPFGTMVNNDAQIVRDILSRMKGRGL